MPEWLEDADVAPWPAAHAGDERAGDDGGAGVRVEALRGGAWLRLAYADGTRFLLERAGGELWAAWEGSRDDAATYLLGPVLGLLLRLRGMLALHAAVASVDGHAVALAGPAGSGKSTAAAAFARAGHAVLADDVAALEVRGGMFHALPGIPQLRLWPDSAATLFGSADALPRLAPPWEKRRMDLGAPGAFAAGPLPLAAVYLLSPRDEARDEPNGKMIGPVAPAAALVELAGQTFAGTLLDAGMRRREFEALERLVRAVPVRRLATRHSREGAGELVAAVADDVWTLRSHAA
ncbi:MAG TPA: hypothetical protein VFS20_09590 [Longimicrobium sp.]|nr:hypothetical protein [Longimicrobium sp.]